jgi:hypothetical protein
MLRGSVLVLAVGAVCFGQAPPSSGEIEIVRLIAAAESAYHQGYGRYTTLPELRSSGQLELSAVQSAENLRAFQRLDPQAGHEPVPGFSLDLTIAPDGSTYRLSLMPKSHTCEPGWFTDNNGTVYESKPVDCGVAEAGTNKPADTSKPAESPAAAPVERTERESGPPPASSALLPYSPRNWAPPDIDQSVPPVQPDSSCPLNRVLAGASKHAEELVDNLQRFSATERIDHIEFGRNGKRRNSQSGVFNYVAQIEPNPTGSLRVDEYRETSQELPPTPLADTGTAAFALIFHPRHITNFQFRCEGLTELHGVPAWQMHFQETPDPMKSFHAIRIAGSVYQLRFKGRAWIAQDSQEVLRLETDLVAPIPEIELQLEHLEIAYAPVDFKHRNLQLWLPESATLYIGYHGRRYERVHSFSRFQLFWVESGQTVKDPTPSPDSAKN